MDTNKSVVIYTKLRQVTRKTHIYSNTIFMNEIIEMVKLKHFYFFICAYINTPDQIVDQLPCNIVWQWTSQLH